VSVRLPARFGPARFGTAVAALSLIALTTGPALAHSAPPRRAAATSQPATTSGIGTVTSFGVFGWD